MSLPLSYFTPESTFGGLSNKQAPATIRPMNPTPRIPNGYYIKARRIEQSEIAHAAPCIREIFDYLIRHANRSEKMASGTLIRRGQCMRSYHDIQEGLHWMVGYRKETYSKTQCENALKWLTNKLMITTAKTTRGLIITVCNYDTYQSPKNYEDNREDNKGTTSRQQPPDTINKKEEELEELKGSFGVFWDAYEKKNDKDKAFQKWVKLTDSDRKAAIAYLPAYKLSQPIKQYRKDPATFLHNRSWLNEIIFPEQQPAEKKKMVL